MKYLVSLSLLFSLFVISIGQDTNTSSKTPGIWFQPHELNNLDFEWQAQWIWLNEKISSDVMLARRSFDLDELPEHAQLRITATSQYQLYINGEYVCRGPARSAPHHQSFDVLNISKLLQKREKYACSPCSSSKGEIFISS